MLGAFSSSRGNDDPWKKYSCTHKNDDEKLIDLYEATKAGRDDVLRILIGEGEVDINGVNDREKGGQGLTALHVAARHNQVDCLKLLIEREADLDKPDNFGFRAIHDAALHGHDACLKELLINGALTTGVDVIGLEHITPLYYSVKYNYCNCLQILEFGIKDFNTIEADNLIWDLGSCNSNTELLSFAQRYKISEDEATAWLRKSAVTGNVAYLKHLCEALKYSGNDEAFTKQHGDLVLLAAQHGHNIYLEELLLMKFDANHHDSSDSTALHYAARYGHVRTIELLVEHGGVLDKMNSDKWAPIHIALKLNNLESICELIRLGCNIDLQGGEDNDTPLHVALTAPVDGETLRELLRNKPSLLIKNGQGKFAKDVVQQDNPLYEVLMEYIRN